MKLFPEIRKRADRKAAEKEEVFRARFDNLEEGYDEHRKAASHAVMMSHHAFEMGTPEAHKAAADAHQKVADMHEEEYKSSETMKAAKKA